MKNIDKKKVNPKKEIDHKYHKRIIMIVIIIIIILLFLTSCAFDFWGKVGNGFGNFSNYEITNDNEEKEKIYNQELKFINKEGTSYVNETYRVEYLTEKINPSKYTCTTSDASLATCLVKDNFVEVYTKKTGNVTIYVQVDTNGKIYIGTHDLTIKEQTRGIVLNHTSGKINLHYNNTTKVSYRLNNIEGDIKIELSNPDIASVSAKNGLLTITGQNVGTTKITLKVNYENREYTATFTLTVVNEEEISLSSENRLANLALSSGNLTPSFDSNQNKYTANVSADSQTISIKLAKQDEKSTLYYYINNEYFTNLDNIKLNYGENIITISVKAEDGSINIYTITINRQKPNDDEQTKSNINTLKSLVTNQGTITPNFNSHITDYTINVSNTDSINIFATLTDSKANMSYILNGSSIQSLNNLKINEGNNDLKIFVTAENGDVLIYNINIQRKDTIKPNLSNINTLDSLVLNNGILTPAFNKDNLIYNVNLNTLDNFNINITKTSDLSSVAYYVNSMNLDSLSNIPLHVGQNTIEIIVTAENKATRTYTINVNVSLPLSDINTLSNIELSTGLLDPIFNKNINNYTIDIPSNINNIKINPIKESTTSTIKYYIDDIEVSNLDIKNINSGTKTIKIVVTSESNIPNTYYITLNKSKDKNNLLKTIKINNNEISNFNSYTNEYDIKLNYNLNSIKLYTEACSNKSSIKYYLEDTEITNIDNINLPNINNKIKIVVTSESGAANTYIINIIKNNRTISLAESNLDIYMEDINKDISYDIYENNIAIEDYIPSDILITLDNNFQGSYKVTKGRITIIPSINDIDKTFNLSVSYGMNTDTMTINIKMQSYNLDILSSTYNIDYVSKEGKRNIIFNTNIFNKDITSSNITNGIKLNNQKGYIDIVSSDTSILTIKYNPDNETNYLAFEANAHNSGTAYVTLTGYVYGKHIATKTIKVNITAKYNVIIDAQDGFFNQFTSIYEFILEENQILKLSDYQAYKEADTGNCMYYTLESFNSKKDGTGINYDTREEIIVNKDIHLYAIYSKDSKYIELTESNIMYLTEVDLFHNEEYYKKYNKDKIIYPGAKGYHIMTIKNTTSSTLKITKMNLKEDTKCLNSDGTKCINMGYIIKHAKSKDHNYTYYYGNESTYEVINKDSEVIKTKGSNNNYEITKEIDFGNKDIIINPGETIEISLLWQWVNFNTQEDNDTDTKIGSITDKNDYSLTVSIEYETTNKHCTITTPQE